MDFFLKSSIIKGQTFDLPFYCFLDKLQFDKQSTNKPNGLTPPSLLEKRERGEAPIAVYLRNMIYFTLPPHC